MAIIAVISDPNDGTLEASTWKHEGGVVDANPDFEDDARRGTGAIQEPGDQAETGQRIQIGGQKWNNGDQTNRYEGFVLFTPQRGLVVPTDGGLQEVVSAALRVSRKSIVYNAPNDSNFGAKDSMGIWSKDWSGELSSSHWFDLMAISGTGVSTNYQPEAELSAWAMDRTGSGIFYEGGGEAFWTKVRDKLASNAAFGAVLLTWTSTQVYPGSYIWVMNLASANDVLTADRYHPTLVTRTQRRHALNYVGGASIQMTDGTAVFLRYDSSNGKYGLYYQRVNQTVPTLIDTLTGKSGSFDNSGGASQYFGQEPAFQAYGLTRDDNNNLYVVGPRGNPQAGTYGQKIANSCGYRYDGNYAWSKFTQVGFGDNSLSSTDTHRGLINNCVPVWLPGGAFPTGRLGVVHSRRDGQWGRYQTGVYVQNAGWNIGAAGVSRGNNINYAGDDSLTSGFWRPYNSSGSNLDAFRDGDTVRIAAAIQAAGNDDAERSGGLTSVINSSNVVGKPNPIAASITTGSPHDPDAKLRAVWLGEGSAYWGIARYGQIQIFRKSDGAIHRQIDLPSSNVSGFPSRAVLQKSQAWDVIWDSNDRDWIWTYFRSSTNPRIINKVRWNFMTGAVDAPFQLTPSPLGNSGAEIVAIRAPRQQVDARCVLVDVAMQEGSGAPSALLTVRDATMNKAPGKPAVSVPISSFNASGTKIVEWSFQDANPSDFATFQDVQIRNVATGATSHSASHVAVVVVNASTRQYRYTIPAVLSNDTSYQIRFRAYDSVDFPSDWTDWIPFTTTTTGGFVQITEPAEDNPPLNRSSIDIRWTYTNSTPSVVQTGYRVRAYNNETGASIYDSTLLTSNATFHTVTGLASDVEYRVEVTVRDSNSQLSGAGVRLVTPDFNNPSVPQITTIVMPAMIEVRVTNPPPSGDNPETIKNQIARKEAKEPESAYLVIGECPPNGVYQDWSVASGVEYTYKARGSSE